MSLPASCRHTYIQTDSESLWSGGSTSVFRLPLLCRAFVRFLISSPFPTLKRRWIRVRGKSAWLQTREKERVWGGRLLAVCSLSWNPAEDWDAKEAKQWCFTVWSSLLTPVSFSAPIYEWPEFLCFLPPPVRRASFTNLVTIPFPFSFENRVLVYWVSVYHCLDLFMSPVFNNGSLFYSFPSCIFVLFESVSVCLSICLCLSLQKFS